MVISPWNLTVYFNQLAHANLVSWGWAHVHPLSLSSPVHMCSGCVKLNNGFIQAVMLSKFHGETKFHVFHVYCISICYNI